MLGDGLTDHLRPVPQSWMSIYFALTMCRPRAESAGSRCDQDTLKKSTVFRGGTEERSPAPSNQEERDGFWGRDTGLSAELNLSGRQVREGHQHKPVHREGSWHVSSRAGLYRAGERAACGGVGHGAGGPGTGS